IGSQFGLLKGSFSSSELELIGVYPVSISSVAVDPRNCNQAYAIGRGLFKTTDFGESWKLINKGVWGGEAIALDLLNPNVLYAGDYSPFGAVYKSTNGGLQWSATSLTNVAINDIEVDPITPRIVYAGGLMDPHVGGMFRTTNGGTAWDTLRNGLGNAYITAIATNPVKPSTLYVGTMNSGVLKSTNGGTSWFQVNQGLPQSLGYLGDLAVDPSHPDTAYAGIQGVYRTFNGGSSWDSITAGLTDRDVRALAVDDQRTEWLFAGTWNGGAFRSFDGGGHWAQMNNGSNVQRITSLSLCSQRVMYAGTGRDGVWRYNFLICSVDENPANPTRFALLQNYPNPFNPSTDVGFRISDFGFVSLKIYDVLGREVATLVNEEKPPGTYEVTFDASSFSSGVYFYRLSAGGVVQTKKLLLLR
ncbi:MAG: T9SS type A sorting domain-containing protein, partial [Bacteroidota bacterium]